jgi:putative redox protein
MGDDMIITFPGGKRVRADYAGFEFATDQPTAQGGDGSAPSPYLMFLASLGTCAGYYALAFCAQRGIPTDGIRLVQRMARDADGHLTGVSIEIEVPPSFPVKYIDPLARAASACAVKKTIEHPPAFEVKTVVVPR